MKAVKWLFFVTFTVLGLHPRCQSYYGEPGKRISFPVQLWSKSKFLMNKNGFSMGADLTYYKNTLPSNTADARVVRQNYAAIPVYFGYDLNTNFFLESGVFAGMGLYRSTEVPVLIGSSVFRDSHFAFDAGLTTSVGCRLANQGVIRLRMSKCLKEATAESKTWMPGRLELSLGLRIP